jgi:flagellar assembly protein FliH
MSGIKLQRFDFGALRDFRGPITVSTLNDEIRVEPPVAAPPAPPSFTEDDLESARFSAKKLGHSEGFAAGIAQAKSESDALLEQANTTILQLGDVLADAVKNYQALLTRESADLNQLVMMIAKKVAGEALNARSVETITAMVTRCLPVIFSKPRLVIHLHPDMFECALTRIETELKKHGFDGEIQFRGAPELGLHDISLDWGAGQANRSTDGLWQEIETLVERIPLEITFAETLKNASGDEESPAVEMTPHVTGE